MPDLAPAADDRYKAAVDTYRSIIRWLIASFGGIGAALLAGIQLTSLGHLDGARLAAAIAAAVLGIAAVLAAIAVAIQVLVPLAASPEALKSDDRFAELRAIKGNDLDTLLRGIPADSIPAFVDDYLESLRRERDLRAQLDGLADTATERAGLQKQLTEAARRLTVYTPVLRSIIGRGLYEHTRSAFRAAQFRMFFAAGFVGASVIAFAYLANPEKRNANVLPEAQVVALRRVRLVLFPDGRRVLATLLPTRCQRDLHATIIGGTAVSPVVLTERHAGCRAVRLTLTGTLGRTVTPG